MRMGSLVQISTRELELGQGCQHIRSGCVADGTYSATQQKSSILGRTRMHSTYEGQNSFVLRGKSAALGGKPDLIAWKGSVGTVIDIKTGQPSPSHSVQVMIYMYAIPRALRQYRGITFNGKVVYADHEVAIPASAVDDNFVGNLSQLILRLASTSPARRIPSRMECGFCNITSADCSDRAAEDILEEGATEDF